MYTRFRSISTTSSIRSNSKSTSSFLNSFSMTTTIFSSEFPDTPLRKHSFSVQASAITKHGGNLSFSLCFSGTDVNSILAPLKTLDSHPSTSMCSMPSGDNWSEIESNVMIGVSAVSLFRSLSLIPGQYSYWRLPSLRALSLALAAGRTVPSESPTAAHKTSTVPCKLLAAIADRRKAHFSGHGSKATKRRSVRLLARACRARVMTVSPRWAPTSTITESC
mmetsp:Transcript_4394/g.9507  ORF Transcript_4394/g.9507 Transcript_4394/m.9507 type:complete len:221 (-) Transcript_4394:22-684(-)